MTLSERWKSFAPVICCLVSVGIDGALPQTSTHPASSKGQRDRIVFSHLMPRLNGDNLKVTIIEVTYGPGESSKAHTPLVRGCVGFASRAHSNVCGKSAVTRAILSFSFSSSFG